MFQQHCQGRAECCIQDLGVNYTRPKDPDGEYKIDKLVTQQLKEVMHEVSVPLYVLEETMWHATTPPRVDEPSKERLQRVLRVSQGYIDLQG